MVPKDDYRYDEWPSRKPGKAAKAAARVQAVTGLSPEAAKVLTPIARRAVTNVGRVVQKAGGAAAAAAGLSTSAAAVALGGAVAGFFLGRAINAFTARMDPGTRKARISLASRDARSELARRLGRVLTPEELKAVYRPFAQAIADIDASERYKSTLDAFVR